MSSERVPQRMDRDMLINAAFDNSLAEGRLQPAFVYRDGRMAKTRAIGAAGEEPGWIAVCGPVLSEHFNSAGRERHKTVLVAFAMAHVKHGSGAVYVTNLKIDSFLQSKAAGIDGGEAGFVARGFDEPKYSSDFLETEHGGKLLLARGAHDV